MNLENWLEKNKKPILLEDISYTLNIGRSHFDKRCALVISSLEELKDKLSRLQEKKTVPGCFQGDVVKKPEDAAIYKKILASSLEELKVQSSEVKYRENLEVLANLYVKGYDLDWELLHQGEAKQKISLPTYPFAKEHYWIGGHLAKEHNVSSVDSKKLVLRGSQNQSDKELIGGSDKLANLTLKRLPSSVTLVKASAQSDVSKKILIDKDTVQIKLTKLVSDLLYLSTDKILSNKPFSELGLDSVLGVELTRKINNEFGFNIPATKLYDYSTIEALANYITDAANENNKNLPDEIELKQPLNMTDGFVEQTKESIVDAVSKHDTEKDIAIIGIAGEYSGAHNIEEFWRNLANGKSSITDVPSTRWSIEEFYDPDIKQPNKSYSKNGGFIDNVDQFDPLFFNISPAEAEWMDPQQRLILQTAWSAIEDAGYAAASLSNSLCGIYVGVMNDDYLEIITKNRNQEWNAQQVMGNSISILAARMPYFLNLKGPGIAIDTACSSSLVAIHLACKALQDHEANLMLAGGVTLYLTESPAHWYEQSRDVIARQGNVIHLIIQADGFVPGEGVGVVVLKRLSNAMRDHDHIYGVIKGSGINQDGKTNGITAPSTLSQKELELTVYKNYHIDPNTISYVEAHGTGTKLGDPIEIQALSEAFRVYTDKKQFCGIGSVKTNIGHTLAAAGVASVIKSIIMFAT